jgi:CHAD domain-containing protein
MAGIEWNGRGSAAANARLRLPGAASEYFAEGRKLAAQAAPAARDLHALRLHTKRLRYTLELFRNVYGKALDDYLAMLRRVQGYLGDINDCAASKDVVFAAMPGPAPLRRKVERYLEERAAKLTADFVKCWREEFDAAGEEQRWREFLGSAGQRGRTRARAGVSRPSSSPR